MGTGDPPIVKSDDPNVYVGCENAFGEQWVFSFDFRVRFFCSSHAK